ncbi:hypothetical protein F7725_008725 [Dissostichus mawsoni]|uniref:Uncharacterized protein n=1 Tax=Dissostichus mawsoni TaxID=36200 RepID=A0A7J5Y7Z3_DISMA|nr:hypothetical protein F7725_008725 [Dissostichus mawsoni]
MKSDSEDVDLQTRINFVDVETELQRRAELQTQILHDHIVFRSNKAFPSISWRKRRRKNKRRKKEKKLDQQEMSRQDVSYPIISLKIVRSEGLRVCVSDEPDHIVHRPGGGVFILRGFGLLWF